MYVCVCVSQNLCKSLGVQQICVCVYVCMDVYIYRHTYIHTYIHAYIHLHFTSTLDGADEWAAEREEREREKGERSRCRTGYHSRQVESANGTTQVGALAQSCIQAVHDSGS